MEMELVTSRHPKVIANYELFREISRDVIERLREHVTKYKLGDDYRVQAYDDIDIFVFHLPTLQKQQVYLDRISYVTSQEFKEEAADIVLKNIIEPLRRRDEEF